MQVIIKFFAICLISFLIASPALGDEVAVELQSKPDLLSTDRMIRLVLSLIAVVALAYGLLGMLAKTSLGNSFRGYSRNGLDSKIRNLEVVDRLALDRTNELLLVEIKGKEQLLLAKTENGLKRLASYDCGQSEPSKKQLLKEHLPELRVLKNNEPKNRNV